MTATAQQKHTKPACKAQRPKANGHAQSDFPPVNGLPKVSLSRYRVAGPIAALLSDGVNDEKGLTETLPRIYQALIAKGMSKAQVASVVWHSEGIGRTVKEPTYGYDWLCIHIERVLLEAQQSIAQRDQALFNEYIYVERQSKYWSRGDRDFVDVDNFNLRLINEYGGDRNYSAHQHFHRHRAKFENSVVADFTYWPGQSDIVEWNGRRCVNRWRAPVVVYGEGDVSLWLKRVEQIIPDQKEREHFYSLMAWIVQHPGRKPGHHLLLGGLHGIGKDSILEPINYAIGGGLPTPGTDIPAGRVNVKHIKTEELESGFHYHLSNQLICIQELREVYVGERRKLGNKLKNYLAAPPTSLTVNEKFAHPYDIPNVGVWMATSNFTDALPLERGERRWFAVWSYAEPMTPKESNALWGWYCAGGVQDVAGWLQRRDVSKFDAHAPAPKTAWYGTLVEAGLTDTEAGFHHLIGERSGPFSKNLVNPQHASEDINRDIEVGRRMGSTFGTSEAMPRKVIAGAVSTALTRAKWVGLGELDTGKPTPASPRLRATLFASPETAAEFVEIRGQKGGHRKLLEMYFASRKPAP